MGSMEPRSGSEIPDRSPGISDWFTRLPLDGKNGPGQIGPARSAAAPTRAANASYDQRHVTVVSAIGLPPPAMVTVVELSTSAGLPASFSVSLVIALVNIDVAPLDFS